MGMSTPATAKPVRFVAYTRVSTSEQGQSGLGLEAQEHACRALVERTGGTLVRVFREIASGDDDHRPGLHEALALAGRMRAVLVVSKLDRLSRAVATVAGLMRRGVALRVVECEHASTLELHIRAVVSEEERTKIGQRTRDALAAAKRRGAKLGSARDGHWSGREDRRQAGAAEGSKRAAEIRRAERADVVSAALPIARELRANGSSLRAIAAELNAKNIPTSRGASWAATTVARLLA